MVAKIDPKRYATMVAAAQRDATQRVTLYRQLAALNVSQEKEAATKGKA
jgi:hypothetical protein